ncbi:MAG: dihydrofolate reductase family protein [Bacteroidota bacterium]|nr:dihydrofolate reductase family protein [Bacteroidota bacterium]
MRKIISFMHISLDGFVAGPNGEMNWINVDEEIFEYVDNRISQTNSALYGRVTYEMMEGYWPNQGIDPDASRHDIAHSRWYNQVHKVVLSESIKGKNIANTDIISDNLFERILEIKRQGSEEILIFGSPTATHSLMAQNLVDGYWLFVNPVILGRGIPLFSGTKERVKLKLLNSHQFGSGVVELNYLVDKS